MHLQPDTLLQGRYRVVRLLAQGGMGAVYEAVDTRLGSSVALKQTLMVDPALREAFEREARLLAALQHPALPVVSDHFNEGGGQFLVMQFIPGEDLAALLRARGAPFPPEQVLTWASGILDALTYLHGRTPPVIHRDIKPQNLKLAPHGGIILLDFGLAKGVTAGQTGPSPSLFGYTPQYAPIEQIQGSGTDARSDLYALAATLAELLTGTPPPDALTRVAATVRGLPDPLRPVIELNPQIPPQLSAAIERSLALNPAMRHASAAAMRADLLSAAQPLAMPQPQGATSAAYGPRSTTRQQPVTGPTVAIGAATGAVAGGGATGTTIAVGHSPGHGRTSLGRFAVVAGGLVAAIILALVLGTLLSRTSKEAGSSATALPVPTLVSATSGVVQTAPAREGPGASFAAPLPYGTAGTYGPLRVRVLDSQRGRDAFTAMRKANQFNDLPPEGYEYFLVKLALEPGGSIGNLYPRLAGDRGVLYAPDGVSPAPLPDTLTPGQTVEAWVPYLVAVGEEDLVIHFDTVVSDPPIPPLFLAADEGARLMPDLTIEDILPDEQGVTHTDPAPFGTTVIAEDYAVTVLEARRGPAVLDALIERYGDVERPRDGYEFALVQLRVRYLGDGGSVGWANLGPGDFEAIRASDPDRREGLIPHPSVYILPEGFVDLDANLLPGGTFEGWTVLELPAGAEDVALVFSPGFALDDLNTRYLALQ